MYWQEIISNIEDTWIKGCDGWNCCSIVKIHLSFTIVNQCGMILIIKLENSTSCIMQEQIDRYKSLEQRVAHRKTPRAKLFSYKSNFQPEVATSAPF